MTKTKVNIMYIKLIIKLKNPGPRLIKNNKEVIPGKHLRKQSVISSKK